MINTFPSGASQLEAHRVRLTELCMNTFAEALTNKPYKQQAHALAREGWNFSRRVTQAFDEIQLPEYQQALVSDVPVMQALSAALEFGMHIFGAGKALERLVNHPVRRPLADEHIQDLQHIVSKSTILAERVGHLRTQARVPQLKALDDTLAENAVETIS